MTPLRKKMIEVILGGELGRTPMCQSNGGAGHDHHIKGSSVEMAGGGIKGGITYGATDELGCDAVENVVHIRDLHATILPPARNRPREVLGQTPGIGHAADRCRIGPRCEGCAGVK